MANEVIERLKANPLVYKGERIVTFDLIDQMHERPEGTAKGAFTRNRHRLKEGIHYYSLTLKELRELGTFGVPNSTKRGNPHQKVFCPNEKGYVMLAKVFDDDRAWAIQEELVDGYFRVREHQESGANAAVLQQIATVLAQVVKRLERIEASHAGPTPCGPNFPVRQRLHELLAIYELRDVKKAWVDRVMRHLVGQCALLGIQLSQVAPGDVLLMPMQFQPWAEKFMLGYIREYIEVHATPLFGEVKGGVK